MGQKEIWQPEIEEDDDLLETWEEDNIEHLERIVEDLRIGKRTLTEHELSEVEEQIEIAEGYGDFMIRQLESGVLKKKG